MNSCHYYHYKICPKFFTEDFLSVMFKYIKNPILTGKTVYLRYKTKENKYVFEVKSSRTKEEIRFFLEKMFSVSVISVRMQNRYKKNKKSKFVSVKLNQKDQIQWYNQI